MNILISNLYRNYIVPYDLNLMKEITGEFDVKEIVEILKSSSYDKVIIDLTAIKGYKDLNNIRILVKEIASDKVYLALANDTICKSEYYATTLVNMGIYNFTLIPGELPGLLVNPRTYEQAKNINYNNY